MEKRRCARAAPAAARTLSAGSSAHLATPAAARPSAWQPISTQLDHGAAWSQRDAAVRASSALYGRRRVAQRVARQALPSAATLCRLSAMLPSTLDKHILFCVTDANPLTFHSPSASRALKRGAAAGGAGHIPRERHAPCLMRWCRPVRGCALPRMALGSPRWRSQLHVRLLSRCTGRSGRHRGSPRYAFFGVRLSSSRAPFIGMPPRFLRACTRGSLPGQLRLAASTTSFGQVCATAGAPCALCMQCVLCAEQRCLCRLRSRCCDITCRGED